MLPIKQITTITVLAMMLSACATPYDTQKSFWSFGKGFETTQIAQDSWQISFVGNNNTDRALTRKYIMRKAAELCHEAGYPYFTYTNEMTNRDAVNQFGVATKDDDLLFGSSSVSRETSSVVEVTGLKLKPKHNQNRVYDTEFILNHLKFDN
ncbi:hypothetical protein JCM19232_3685 [Vibrio ishigakensis]|uniref:Lipoprotein n=1 Tax=Vibrio ishigakensis TaxID=1481914 RepID=A0A0B8PBZ7_9VIBR|nr:hypothetical protein JCM19232_3685 [Vibrio ishigakensis]